MNSKNSILLIDPEFDPNEAAACDLLVKVGTDSFSYAIIDKSCNLVRAVYDEQECGDPEKVLADRLKSDSYLGLPFRSVKISVRTENTVTIPNELFNPALLDQYAGYFTEEQSARLYVQPFNSYGFTSVFNLSSAVEDTLSGSLSLSKRYDQAAPQLALAKDNPAAMLLLDFTAGSFHAASFRNGGLVFQRGFRIENSEEFNYYLLLIISQLKLDTAGTEIRLSGIIHEDDGNYRCIAKYFSDIRFSNAVSEGTAGSILDDMPAHYYSSLLALDLCE